MTSAKSGREEESTSGISFDLVLPPMLSKVPISIKIFPHVERKVSQRSGDVDSHVDLLHIPSLGIGDYLHDIYDRVTGVQFYEERMLCFLLHLNNPKNRVVYVTSMPVSPTVVEYYLSLLTNVSIENARRRLSMICCYDVSTDPLAEKLLKRPRLLERIKRSINPSETILSTYAHTKAEEEIALKLGISHAISPIRSFYGTKAGSRLVFQKVGVPHCFGVHESLYSANDIVESVIEMLKERPDLNTLMVKLNEGVSGFGNAKWNLPPQGEACRTDKDALTRSLLTNLEPTVSKETPTEFLNRLSQLGGIVEEYVEISDLRSPSAQGRVLPDGSVEIVSTHEQVLHNGIYDGCIFPARQEYRMKLQKYCNAVGEFLSSKGVRDENFGVDFVAWLNDEQEWQLLAIEINLRNLGTTHPMMTLQFVTVDGKLTPNGEFVDRHGQSRCYFAIDSFFHESLKTLTPDDLFDLVQTNKVLQYDKQTSCGTIFYMLDALPSFGKLGIMCIQDTASNALMHFAKVKQFLLEECAEDSSK